MTNEVLIIEDLDSDYEMMERGFRRREEASAKVLRMRGVGEATQYLDQTRTMPGMIILDLFLSDGDGRELLAEFRGRAGWRDVPVIVWSAYTEPEIRDICLEGGASAFFPKAADSRLALHNIDSITSEWLKRFSAS